MTKDAQGKARISAQLTSVHSLPFQSGPLRVARWSVPLLGGALQSGPLQEELLHVCVVRVRGSGVCENMFL